MLWEGKNTAVVSDWIMRLVPIISMLFMSYAANADAGSSKECHVATASLGLSASVIERTKLQVTVVNCTSGNVAFMEGAVRPPFLRIFVVDKFGDALQRNSWIGDRSPKKITLAPQGRTEIVIDLDEWYQNLESDLNSGCLDLLWALHVAPIQSQQSFFGGGAIQLNCVANR